MFSQEKGELWRGLGALSSTWMGHRRAGKRVLTRTCSDRKGEDGFKLQEVGFRLLTRRKAFIVRVVRPWKGLPGGAVDALTLKCPRPGWIGL